MDSSPRFLRWRFLEIWLSTAQLSDYQTACARFTANKSGQRFQDCIAATLLAWLTVTFIATRCSVKLSTTSLLDTTNLKTFFTHAACSGLSLLLLHSAEVWAVPVKPRMYGSPTNYLPHLQITRRVPAESSGATPLSRNDMESSCYAIYCRFQYPPPTNLQRSPRSNSSRKRSAAFCYVTRRQRLSQSQTLIKNLMSVCSYCKSDPILDYIISSGLHIQFSGLCLS